MFYATSCQRGGLTGAALLLCLVACDSVLGIEEPRDRPSAGGEAGDGPTSAGSGGSLYASAGGTMTLAPAGSGSGGDPVPGHAGAGTDGGAGGDGGLAGAGGDGCTPDEARCGGDGSKTPEVCDELGNWVLDTQQGECAVKCSAGSCVECEEEQTRCTSCAEDDAGCNPRQLQRCVDGAWIDDMLCANYCDAGQCRTPTSCLGAQSRGICSELGASCCESILVPGGTFNRDYDPEIFPENSNPTRVSAYFLDKYEVTVGRMKQFIAAYEPFKDSLVSGAGKAAHISEDPGWSETYDLPEDSPALVDSLTCPGSTLSAAEDNIRTALNCVSFNLAYAFCIWDGGRLPTDAEWNFAAAGGTEQRTYPWGDLDVSGAHGHFFAEDHLAPVSVGLTKLGDARWGHSDLSGNVSEWVLDYYYEEHPASLCDDCLAATPSELRAFRGAPFTSPGDYQYGAYRDGWNATLNTLGFRCARDLE